MDMGCLLVGKKRFGLGIVLREHERIRRTPAVKKTTFSTTPKPDKKNSGKHFPSLPKQELDPETETVAPNDTDTESELPEGPEELPPPTPIPEEGSPSPGEVPQSPGDVPQSPEEGPQSPGEGSPPGESLPSPGGSPPPPESSPRPVGPTEAPPGYPHGYEICYNQRAFQPSPEDSTDLKMHKEIVKMQCDFVGMHMKLIQFQQNLRKELLEVKKLNYNLAARVDRLDSMLRASPY